MPIPQVTPPGHLELHTVLVALTPAMLALATGVAVAIAGSGRKRLWIGWIGLMAALAVQALFLVPGRAATAYVDPLMYGMVRIGWMTALAAILAGGWTMLWWRPRRVGLISSGDHRPRARWSPTGMGWCARVALALALSAVALPGLVIPVAIDARCSDRSHLSSRIVVIAVLLALMATAGSVWAAYADQPRTVALIHALVCLLTLIALRGAWRVALGLAGLAHIMVLVF